MLSFLPQLGPLRDSRQFRLLYCSQFVAGFGSAITYVVLPLQMYRLTRSPLQVGLLGVVEFIPLLLFAFIGGVLADRLERRRLILTVEALQALVLAFLTWNGVQPTPAIWPLWVGAGVLAALSALHRPAMEALTPQIVPTNQMAAVAAWNSLRGNFAHIAGPGVAGVIASTFGAGIAFGLNAATYAVSIALMAVMAEVPRVAGHDDELTWHSLLEGWRYARSRQELLGTYLIDINAMFFGMPNALFPAIAEQWGAGTVGLLYAAPSVGALIASATSRWAEGIEHHGLAITWAAAIWGAGIVGFGFSTNLWIALGFLALAGAADMISGLFRMTMWNQTIPGRLRGRMAAIEMVSYTSGPYLGNAEAGLAAKAFGLQASVVGGGVLCCVGSVVLAMLLPRFRTYRAVRS